jgi:nitrile hydratase
VGKIERICGMFENPEELAFGRLGGDKKVLYRVRFSQCDIWPDYGGAKNDKIDIELYDFWLENLEEERK